MSNNQHSHPSRWATKPEPRNRSQSWNERAPSSQHRGYETTGGPPPFSRGEDWLFYSPLIFDTLSIFSSCYICYLHGYHFIDTSVSLSICKYGSRGRQITTVTEIDTKTDANTTEGVDETVGGNLTIGDAWRWIHSIKNSQVFNCWCVWWRKFSPNRFCHGYFLCITTTSSNWSLVWIIQRSQGWTLSQMWGMETSWKRTGSRRWRLLWPSPFSRRRRWRARWTS